MQTTTTRTSDAMTTSAVAMQYKARWELREMLDEVESGLAILSEQLGHAADKHDQAWYSQVQRQMGPLDDKRRELRAALATRAERETGATKAPATPATRTASEIMEDVYDLMATANRMAERYGWDDARVAAIQADIERYTARAETLRAQARHAA